MKTVRLWDAELQVVQFCHASCGAPDNFPICEAQGLSYNRKALGLTESTLVPVCPSGWRDREAGNKIVLYSDHISIPVYFYQIVHCPSCFHFVCMPLSVVNPEYFCSVFVLNKMESEPFLFESCDHKSVLLE